MNRYKVITLTSDYYVMADYYDISHGILDLYINDEEVGASFVDGFWKAVMICDDNEGREVYRCDKCKDWPELKSVKAFTDSQKIDRVCESV